MKIFAQNKKARFEFEWLDTLEVGIVLEGAEVKSIRASKISLKESFVKIRNGEVFLTQSHITVPGYVPHYARFEETRERKLLLHKKEITKLKSKLEEKGLTLIVSKIYQSDSSKKIKVELVLARGKKLFDKKQSIKERDIKREMDRTIKRF